MDSMKHRRTADARPQRPSARLHTPPEFRRLALNCPAFKEIVAEYEAGQFRDWEMALSAAVFSLSAELETAKQRGAA